MQEFAYEALMPNGHVTSGQMPAANEDELEATLRAMGHYLIRAQPVASAAAKVERVDGAVPHRDLVAFTEYLWASVEAGIPILTTLEDLEQRVETRRLRQIVGQIRTSVRDEGKSLSAAVAEHPKAFPPLFAATIAAGETSGRLDYALEQLTDFLEWQQEIRSHIRQATFYPVLLLVGMLALIILLLGFVYPRLLPIFTSFGIELPVITRVLMAASVGFLAYWPYLLGLLVLLVLASRVMRFSTGGNIFLDRLKLRLPIFGPLLRSVEMARFVTYLSLFYRTGIDLLSGLDLLERIVGNRALQKAVAEARESITAGDSLSEAFSYSGMFPPIVLRGLALGEATGKVEESLARAKTYYDREVPASVDRMLAALQPLLVVVMGVLLLIVTMSIFLPILSIYNNLGA